MRSARPHAPGHRQCSPSSFEAKPGEARKVAFERSEDRTVLDGQGGEMRIPVKAGQDGWLSGSLNTCRR